MTTIEPGGMHAVPETRRKRYAGEQRFAGTGVFECTDGYIYMMAGGIGANKFWSYSLQYWIVLDHPEMGRTIHNAPPFRCSRIPAAISRPAPLLGEHTREVLHELIGMTPAEVQQLAEEGVLR